jgi:hypothetical protein
MCRLRHTEIYGPNKYSRFPNLARSLSFSIHHHTVPYYLLYLPIYLSIYLSCTHACTHAHAHAHAYPHAHIYTHNTLTQTISTQTTSQTSPEPHIPLVQRPRPSITARERRLSTFASIWVNLSFGHKSEGIGKESNATLRNGKERYKSIALARVYHPVLPYFGISFNRTSC